MITALDTNILIALWDRDEELNSLALAALDNAFAQGALVISGAVFSELMAFPKKTENFLDSFLSDTQITVDWTTDENIWRLAGRAFRAYADRRRKQRSGEPRRILADFFIGAHALENGYSLMTLDDGIYRAAFPKLEIIRI